MPDTSASEVKTASSPPKPVRPSAAEFFKAAIALVFLFYVARWAYNNFLAPDDPPITVDSNALGEVQLGTIIAASKENELRFKADFKGKQFSASGQFKEANKDLTRYHVAVTIGMNEVACDTNDPNNLNTVSKLRSGDPVRIYGIVDDTWMGDLLLSRCAVTN